jgi:nucleoid DNA-binding protein
MKKNDLAGKLARQTRIPKAAAADQLDRLIHEIIANLKKGQPARLPGLGTFLPGLTTGFHFENSTRKGRRREK